MGRAVLICVSGIESSGKSTQLSLLMEKARSKGERPVQLWTRPGYTRTLEAAKRRIRWIRQLRRRPGASAASNAGGTRVYPRRAETFRGPVAKHVWLSLALLDLAWWYGVRVRVWRATGRTVVCDRYLRDCWVDFRVNFPDDDIESSLLARTLAAVAPTPDVTVFLHIPVEESLQRSTSRERRFRESSQVLERRLAEYEALARESDATTLDGRLPAEELALQIGTLVDDAGRSAEQRA